MKDICRGDDEHFQLSLHSVRCLKLFLKREKCNFDNLSCITWVPVPFLWGLIALIDTEQQKIIVWMFIIAIIIRMISVIIIFLQPGQGRRDLFCSTYDVKLCGDISEDRDKC